jgi:hypothetical protein
VGLPVTRVDSRAVSRTAAAGCTQSTGSSELPLGGQPEGAGLADGLGSVGAEAGGDFGVEEVFDAGVESDRFGGLPAAAEAAGPVAGDAAGGEGVVVEVAGVFEAGEKAEVLARLDAGAADQAEVGGLGKGLTC